MKSFLRCLINFLAIGCIAMDRGYISPIAIGSSHLLLISNDNQVLSFGDGKDGALGHNDTKSIIGSSAKPMVIEFFSGKLPKSVAAGHGFSSVLLHNGSVYNFGKNDNGQLVYDTAKNDGLLPQEIEILREEEIIQIAAGEYFTIGLNSLGEIFVWGSGYEKVEKIVSLKGTLIKKIAVGAGIILAIDTNDDLWSINYKVTNSIMKWKGDFINPCKVNELGELCEKVKLVAAGTDHVILLTTGQAVFSYGNNTNGQLGHGNFLACNLPQKIEALEGKSVVKVVAGANFSATLCQNGDVWWFGTLNIESSWNQYVRSTPTKFEGMKEQKITDIMAGPLCNTLLIMSKGNLFVFGGPALSCNLGHYHKSFFDVFKGIHTGYWTKENHSLQNRAIRDAVFTMLVLNTFYFNPKIPNDALFLIFGFLM